jgi:neutral ceramidase
MSKKNIIGFLIMVINIFPGLIFGQQIAISKTMVKLGVSEIKITPEKPILMSGYSARKTPFTRVHDDLFASALFFSGEKDKALVITADLIGFSFEFIDEIKKTISKKIGIPAENIIITAVHNHGGPVTKVYEGEVSEEIENYVKSLKEKLINMALDASKKAVPFRMGIGKGTCNMNVNRRSRFSNGSIGLGKNPDGICDHTITVVKLEDLNNNLLAVFLNWPCHATASGDNNYQITADWPGAASRYIKKQSGSNIVVAITAGASGNIDPIYGPDNDFSQIEATGFLVGTEAWNLIPQIKTFPVFSLSTANTSISFAGKKRGTTDFPVTSYESGPEAQIILTGLKIGNLVLAGISGELMTEIGMEVKKQSPYSGTIIVTHCNGSSGYICTDKAFSEGGYEVNVSKFMPGIEKPLIQKFMELIDTL